MLALSSLAFRSLASNRLRTGVLIGAMLLSIASFSAVLLTNDAIARGLEVALRTTIGRAHLQIRTVSSVGFSEDTLGRIRSLPGVTTVAATARKRVFYRTDRDYGFVELIAIDPAAEQRVRSYALASGAFLSSDQPDAVLVRAAWAAERGVGVGTTIELITQEGLAPFTIGGVLRADEAGLASYGPVILVGFDTARRQFGMQDRSSTVAVVLESEARITAVRAAVAQVVPEAHVVRSAVDVRAELNRTVGELQALLLLFGATALFVAIFLILNTLEMTVIAQIREIGQLRAAGATQRQVAGYILVQAVTPGLGGSLLGSLAGFGLALVLAWWIQRSQEVAIAPIEFSPLVATLSLVVGLGVVLGAAITPVRRAITASPIELISSQPRTEASSGRLVALGIGLVALATVGLVLPITGSAGQGLRAILVFPFLAGLVLATRAIVVPLGRLVGLPFRWIPVAGARLAARNVIRQVGRTSLTVGGFMVSLALLVGVATVAASTIQSGERWTLSLLPSEYVVVSPVDQPPIFIDQFSRLPGVASASAVSFFAVRAGETSLQIAAVDPEVYAPNLTLLEGDREAGLAAFTRGGSVLVPRRLAEARGLRRGDTLQVTTTGGLRPFTVAGVIPSSFPSADGGAAVLMSRADAERFFGQTGFRLLMIQPAAGANAGDVARRIAEQAERYGMSVTTAQAIAADVAAALARLLALLGALVAIGLLITAFGTANTMLVNLVERQRELSVLWAAGMSRNQLRNMAMTEAGMMGLMGGILGIGVGALLAWLLVSFSRTPGFEPAFVFPWPVAIGGIMVSAATAALAALIPARRIVRLAVH